MKDLTVTYYGTQVISLTLICLFSSRSRWASICNLLHSSMIFFTSLSSRVELNDFGGNAEESDFSKLDDIILLDSMSCWKCDTGRQFIMWYVVETWTHVVTMSPWWFWMTDCRHVYLEIFRPSWLVRFMVFSFFCLQYKLILKIIFSPLCIGWCLYSNWPFYQIGFIPGFQPEGFLLFKFIFYVPESGWTTSGKSW